MNQRMRPMNKQGWASLLGGSLTSIDLGIKETYLSNLIDSHWDFIEGLLQKCHIPRWAIKLGEFLYKEAFRHGYKHGRKDND